MKRVDAARNRAKLLEAATRLVTTCGVEGLTMQAVAAAAGVGKGTVFRHFTDRDGLLLALLSAAETEFREAYTSGPPPLGPGAPAGERLVAFGCALIERTASATDLGAALSRELQPRRRQASDTGWHFHRHVAALLRQAAVAGDCTLLAHALLSFLNFETTDFLRDSCRATDAQLKETWADLVWRVAS
ncbi:TetR/AcrR family transcriptional regulator [Streptomyces sp. NPDC085932]|uniref:TetR/AcrR family transcriptional regulator n=1 Tax=Streptomyces sp. NPDC085932 TaxID=3365741 RepID=UPI0037D34FB8